MQYRFNVKAAGRNAIQMGVMCANIAMMAALPVPAQAQDKLTIGVIELFRNPHFAHAREGINDAAAENNVEVNIQNADLDAAKEAEFVQTFVTRGVDAILWSVVSPTGSLNALKQAQTSKIPVVCYTTCLNPPEDQKLTKAFIKSDNTLLGTTTGKAAADYIRDELGGTAKILMLTCESYDVCKERRVGINKELEGLDVTIASEQEGFVVDKARPIAESMLSANPAAQVFIAENEDGIIAAAQAIKAQGLTGKVAVFGIDINTQVAQIIASGDGIVHWTTGQDPYCLGKRGIEVAIKAIKGEPVGDYYQVCPSPTFSKDYIAAEKKNIAHNH